MYLLMYVWFLYVSPQSQPLSPSLQSQTLSHPTPFSYKTSIATCLSRKSQAFSWKPFNVTPQSQVLSHNFSFATLQSQTVCCNLSLGTIQPNPSFTSGWKSSAATLQSQSFILNPLLLTFQFQAAFNSLNI